MILTPGVRITAVILTPGVRITVVILTPVVRITGVKKAKYSVFLPKRARFQVKIEF